MSDKIRKELNKEQKKNMIICNRPQTHISSLAYDLHLAIAFVQGNFQYRNNRRTLPYCINWGIGSINTFSMLAQSFGYTEERMLNKDITNAQSKIKFLKLCKDASIETVPWGSFEELKKQFPKSTIYCRKDMMSQGRGIKLCSPKAEKPSIETFDFCTARVVPKREYRIHIFPKNQNGILADNFFVQKKVKIKDNADLYIRNFKSGWAFTPKLVEEDSQDELTNFAQAVLKATSLDFGAIDLLRTKDNKLVALEINSAPAISADSTVRFYTTCLQSYI